jgi:hypothetical protein
MPHICQDEIFALLTVLPVVSGIAITIRSWISKIKKVR